MKFVMAVLIMLFSSGSQAHHSKDHMMLLKNTEQVIASTQQGAEGSIFLLLWIFAFILLLLGFVRWWKERS